MKKIYGLLLALIISYIPNVYAIDQTKQALEITTRAFGRSMDFTSDTTTSTRDKFKMVQAAKGDAAVYVASDGVIQGAYLTEAIAILREKFPEVRDFNKLELAKAILSVK